jgi:hypothetical protein
MNESLSLREHSLAPPFPFGKRNSFATSSSGGDEGGKDLLQPEKIIRLRTHFFHIAGKNTSFGMILAMLESEY